MSVSVFVVVPAVSRYGIIVGKNSNRPAGEVQELVYERVNSTDSKEIKCTNISLPSLPLQSSGVILSKPAEIWGCEMGANESGVVGCTVPVLKDNLQAGLIPQDLVRLALERSSSAESAVEAVGSILRDSGSETDQMAFLFADKLSAWYVEAVGKAWVAQKLSPGVRMFPSSKKINKDYEKAAPNLEEIARESASWMGEGAVSWCDTFLPDDQDTGKLLELENILISSYFSDITDFGVKEMTRVLRDTDNRVNRPTSDTLPTAASQISVLPKAGPECHWFTATPDATLSVFKPFMFTPNVRISIHTKSPDSDNHQHNLYKLHATATTSGENKEIALLQEMEANCLNEVDNFMFDGNPMQSMSEADDLLKDCVEAEVRFYK